MSNAGDRIVVLPRELVLASAGAGKTFRISSRIIGLLAHGESPDAILASTFTRKAAGEILGRVLVRIAEASLDPAAADALAGHAGVALDRGRCGEMLADLVRRLHRLHISTIDAFFVRAARAFAHDLGLPPGWTIANEATTRRLRTEAVQQALRRADAGVLVELVRLANRGRAARSIHDGVLRDLDALHGILHQLDPTVAEPWGRFDGDADAAAPGPAEAEEVAREIARIEPPPTSKGTPNQGWAKALDDAAERVRARDWTALVDKGIGKKVLEGADAYNRAPISAEVRETFERALDLARRELRSELSAQARALGRLVGFYDGEFSDQQRRAAAYRFQDVTRLLGGPDPLCERLDIYYRLDMRTRHLLLDEFQDTSLTQWAALRPLADEACSGGQGDRAAVIVADPKQSIYGWRDAEPALVHHVGEWYSLDRDTLALSWRSSQVVLDAVNRTFTDLAGSPALEDRAEHRTVVNRKVAEEWARSFAPHAAARELPGHVRVEVGPADDGRSSHRPRLLAHTAERVRELRDRAPGFGIGVLTRTNKAVARLIHELRRRGVHASEEGGNPLTDAASVAAVLALLRMADHPGDRIARYHVARSPLGAAIGYTDPTDAAAARTVARDVRRRLLGDGYGATLHRYAGAIGDACDARQRRRLGQLVEFGYRYEDEATLRPTDFVRRVETERVEDPTQAGVRVMTVHQSKGLEFDIVVLPELDASLFGSGRGGGALPWRDSPTGPVTRVFPYIRGSVRALFPEVEAAAMQARGAVLRDSLSSLYVAMTRARHVLHVIVKPDEGRPPPRRTAAAIVRAALAPGQEATPDSPPLFEHGDPRWFERRTKDFEPPAAAADGASEASPAEASAAESAAAKSGAAFAGAAFDGAVSDGAAAATDAAATGRLLGPAPDRRSRVLPRRTPSGLAHRRTIDLAEILRIDSGAALERGSIVHAWCEAIEWLDDGSPAPEPDRLRAVARRVAPLHPPAAVDGLVDEFRGWLARPEIATVFRRDNYAADAVAERELAFVHRTGDAIVEGVVDRLVRWRAADGAERAEIIDFKTDAVDDREALDARVLRYSPQLEAYREAVAEIYGLEPARVTARLAFFGTGAVREI